VYSKFVILLVATFVIGGCATSQPFNDKRAYVDRNIICFAGSLSYSFASGSSFYADQRGKNHDVIGFISSVKRTTMKDQSIDWDIRFNEKLETGFYKLMRLEFNDEVNSDGYMYGNITALGVYNPEYNVYNEIDVGGKAYCTYLDGENERKLLEVATRHEQSVDSSR